MTSYPWSKMMHHFQLKNLETVCIGRDLMRQSSQTVSRSCSQNSQSSTDCWDFAMKSISTCLAHLGSTWRYSCFCGCRHSSYTKLMFFVLFDIGIMILLLANIAHKIIVSFIFFVKSVVFVLPHRDHFCIMLITFDVLASPYFPLFVIYPDVYLQSHVFRILHFYWTFFSFSLFRFVICVICPIASCLLGFFLNTFVNYY